MKIILTKIILATVILFSTTLVFGQKKRTTRKTTIHAEKQSKENLKKTTNTETTTNEIQVTNSSKESASSKENTPTTTQSGATAAGSDEDEDEDEESLFNVKEMKNPYESMMAGAMENSFSSGLSDVGNLEKAMSEIGGDENSNNQKKDSVFKYDVVLTPNLSLDNFDMKGVWKIAFKETFDDHRITPFHKNYDLKPCLNDTVLIAQEYLYATTTCLNNLLFFNTADIKKNYFSLSHAFHSNDIKDATAKKSNKPGFVIDTSGTIYQSFLASLYERFGVDDIPTLTIPASKLKGETELKFYVLSNNLMMYFFNSAIYYLERFPEGLKQINYSLPVEQNYTSINWKQDPNNYTLITGKYINDFNLFIEEDRFLALKNVENKIVRKPKLHITFYPPVIGDNNLSISNTVLNAKTNTLSSVELYNSEGPINSVKQIYIPLENVHSPLFTVNFMSNESKKYSWGMKYKIIYK